MLCSPGFQTGKLNKLFVSQAVAFYFKANLDAREGCGYTFFLAIEKKDKPLLEI